MTTPNGWLQDIEAIKEPEQDPNISRSSVFGCLKACSAHNVPSGPRENLDDNLSKCKSAVNTSKRLIMKLEEDSRNFRRQLELEHRKRDIVESKLQNLSTTILARDEVSTRDRESTRHIVKNA